MTSIHVGELGIDFPNIIPSFCSTEKANQLRVIFDRKVVYRGVPSAKIIISYRQGSTRMLKHARQSSGVISLPESHLLAWVYPAQAPVAIYFRDLLVLMHQIMKVTERYVDEESTHGVNTQKLLIA